MPKHTVYIPDSIEEIIAVPEGSPESYSGRLAYLISLADTLAREQMPELSDSEWGAIIDANIAAIPQYSAGVEGVLAGLWHNLFDFAPKGDKKYGVDCAALARRMQSMPIGAQAAVFEVIKQILADPEKSHKSEGYADAIRMLGARVKD